MGKKSSSKKLRSSANSSDSAEGAKKDKKGNSATPSENSSNSFKIHRLLIIGITIFALILLGFISVTAWGQLTTAKPIAKYLPADSIVAVAEINTQFDRPEWQNFFKKFEKTAYLQKDYWIKEFEKYTQINFEKQIQPWLNRKVGVAFLENFSPIFFLETKNIQKSMDFFSQFKLTNVEEKLEQKNYEGMELYTFSVGNGATMAFLGNYLVMTPDQKVMENLIQAMKNPDRLLWNDIQYQEASGRVAARSQAFIFINSKAIFQKMIAGKIKTDSPLNILHPLVKGLQGQAWTAQMKGEKLVIGNFIAYQKTPLKFERKYEGKLTSFLPENPDFVYGSSNLKSQTEQIAEILTKPVVDAFLGNEVKKWTGEKISLEQALDLFQDEYIVAKKGEEYFVITRLERPEEQGGIIQKALKGFQKARPIFEPVFEENIVKGHTEKIMDVMEKYENFKIYGMEIEGRPWGIYCSIIGNTAICGSTKSAVRRSIDAWKSGGDREKSFTSKDFEKLTEKSDEIFSINGEILGENWKDIFKNLIVGWKYSEDGIKGEAVIIPTPVL